MLASLENKVVITVTNKATLIKATSPGEWSQGMCNMLIRQSHPPGMNILETLRNTNVVATYVCPMIVNK